MKLNISIKSISIKYYNSNTETNELNKFETELTGLEINQEMSKEELVEYVKGITEYIKELI